MLPLIINSIPLIIVAVVMIIVGLRAVVIVAVVIDKFVCFFIYNSVVLAVVINKY